MKRRALSCDLSNFRSDLPGVAIFNSIQTCVNFWYFFFQVPDNCVACFKTNQVENFETTDERLRMMGVRFVKVEIKIY